MLLITGATGKTGGETARQLARAGIPFRVLVRNPARLDALVAANAGIVTGDIADAETLDRALKGVSRALLVLPNGEDQLVMEKRFTDHAARAGVQHLIKLSSLESVPASTNPITSMHVASEQHIRDSGLAWTMVRPTFFTQAFLASAAAIRDKGLITMPAGTGTIAPTDIRDVGSVILLALTENGHENQSYDLTGPELLTFSQIAGCFSRVLGRDVRYVDQPLAAFRARLEAAGLAPWRVAAVCKELEAIAAGVIDHTTGTISRLLGRPPISLERFIRDHLAVFS